MLEEINLTKKEKKKSHQMESSDSFQLSTSECFRLKHQDINTIEK